MHEIRRAVATDPSSALALDSVLSATQAAGSELTILFCSARRNLAEINRWLKERGRALPLIGATSAGEITPQGYLAGSVTAVSFPPRFFKAATARIDGLGDFKLSQASQAVRAARKALAAKLPRFDARRCFAVLLVDGTAYCEESLVAALAAELDGIPLIGGSAAYDWPDPYPKRSQRLRTCVLHGGRWHTRCAVLALIHTRLPWQTFTHNHYVASPTKAVITTADSARRRVFEINGLPAAPTYARLCGLPRTPRTALDFSAHPAMVSIGGQWFPRGVLKLHPDRSMEFACAIEQGLVVSVGRSGPMLNKLRTALEEIEAQLGPLALVLAFDCAGRRVTMDEEGIRPRIEALLQRHNAIGLSTLGEQYNAIHMNHSFTAVAIGGE
jgi:hypothetical protein